MNSAAINVFAHVFHEEQHLFLLGIYPEVELLGNRFSMLVLVNATKQISKVVVPIYTPISNVWEF